MLLTGCKFSIVQMRLDAAQREGDRIRREQCAEKNVRDFEPEYGTVMRRIATFAGPGAVEVLPARISVFFHAFKSLERLPKLATSSVSLRCQPCLKGVQAATNPGA